MVGEGDPPRVSSRLIGCPDEAVPSQNLKTADGNPRRRIDSRRSLGASVAARASVVAAVAPSYSRVGLVASADSARPFAELEMPNGIKLRVCSQTGRRGAGEALDGRDADAAVLRDQPRSGPKAPRLLEYSWGGNDLRESVVREPDRVILSPRDRRPHSCSAPVRETQLRRVLSDRWHHPVPCREIWAPPHPPAGARPLPVTRNSG